MRITTMAVTCSILLLAACKTADSTDRSPVNDDRTEVNDDRSRVNDDRTPVNDDRSATER